MQYRFYIDSFFLLQLFQNLFVTLLIEEICGGQSRWWKKLLCAAALAVLSVSILMLPLPGFLKITAGSVLDGSILTGFVLQESGAEKKKFVTGFSYFWISTFLLGGSWIAVQNLLFWLSGHPAALPGQLASGFLSVCGLKRAIRIYRKHKKQQIFTVELKQGERKLLVQGLADSGNSLTDPLSGRPVCLIDKVAYEKFLPAEYRRQHPEKFRAIPFHSVGKEHGMLEGFLADQITVCKPGEICRMENVILAQAPGAVGLSERYEMILNRCF